MMLGTIFIEIGIKIEKEYSKENGFENAVCK